jgi:hypothetical protein
MELIDRVCEVCASGGLTSEALEKFAPKSRLIESEIRLDKASMCRATVFRGNGGGSTAHYFVRTGAWGTA